MNCANCGINYDDADRWNWDKGTCENCLKSIVNMLTAIIVVLNRVESHFKKDTWGDSY